MAEIHTLPRTRAALTLFVLLVTIPVSLFLVLCSVTSGILNSVRKPLTTGVIPQLVFCVGVGLLTYLNSGVCASVFFTGLSVVAFYFSKDRTPTKATVMVTGGKMSKSLHFARWFWKCGYRVVLVETSDFWCSGSRFSRAVSAFYTVTPPTLNRQAYISELSSIAQKESVKYFVPVSSALDSVNDSYAKTALEKLGCAGLHFSPEITEILDQKHSFSKFVEEKLSLRVPRSYKVESSSEVHSLNESLKGEFILKNLDYDQIHRLDMFKLPCSKQQLEQYLSSLETPISKEHPWQVQEFIKGTEYAAFAVLREGNIRAIVVSESSSSQLNYSHKQVPQIENWLEGFAKGTKLTGQVSFDFIVDSSQTAYCIECNPRVHSQCSVFLDKEEFGEAVLGEHWESTLKPSKNSPETYWFYNEFFKLLPNWVFNYGSKSLKEVATTLKGKEAILESEDPLPFLMMNHFQAFLLVLSTFVRGRPWKKIDFCIGKVVELNSH